MAFTEEDKHVITFLRKNKNYGAKRFLKEFPNKGWTRGGLNALLSSDIRSMMSPSFVIELRRRGTKWISVSLMSQSISGVLVFAHAWMPKEDNLNINFNFLSVQ